MANLFLLTLAALGTCQMLVTFVFGMEALEATVSTIVYLVVLVPVAILALAFSPAALPMRHLSDEDEKPRRSILTERYARSKVAGEAYDVVVIGSGMGGLTTAACVARYGKRVLVVEQHELAGGGTHTFNVDGKTEWTFDSGLHYAVPYCAQLLQLACGTYEEPVKFEKLGEEDGCFDQIVLGEPDAETNPGFRIKHHEAHLPALREMFPEPEAQAQLETFLTVSDQVMREFPMWMLSKALPIGLRGIWRNLFLQKFQVYAGRTAEDVLNEIVPNKKLASILCGLWIDTGSPPDRATFMLTAAVFRGLPQEGGAYPVGGSQAMATCLIQAVERAGGKVLMRAKAQEILVEKNVNGKHHVTGVKLHDDTVIATSTVISGCGYKNTYMKLLPRSAVPAAYGNPETRELPKFIRDSAGFVMVNVGLNGSPRELGIGCSNVWVQPATEKNGYNIFEGIREYFADPLTAEVIPMMITFPSIKNHVDKDASKTACQILVFGEYEQFEEWAKENGDHPKDGEYEQLKKRWADKIVPRLTQRFPKTQGKIEFVDVSTPLAIEYYLNKSRGGAVGLDMNPERFTDARVEALLDMKSPVEGLWLTGEDTMLCGQPIAQIAGLITALRCVGVLDTISFVLSVVRLAVHDWWTGKHSAK